MDYDDHILVSARAHYALVLAGVMERTMGSGDDNKLALNIEWLKVLAALQDQEQRV